MSYDFQRHLVQQIKTCIKKFPIDIKANKKIKDKHFNVIMKINLKKYF